MFSRLQALLEGKSVPGRGHDVILLGLHGPGHGDVLPVHALSHHSGLAAATFRCSAGAFRKWEVRFEEENLSLNRWIASKVPFGSSRVPGISIPSDRRRGAPLSGGSMARSISVFCPLVEALGTNGGVPTSGSLPSRLHEASVRRHRPGRFRLDPSR